MIDQDRIAKAVREIISAVGEDPTREGLIDTPRRVAKMYADFFQGLTEDPKHVLLTSFDEKYEDIVVFRDISFFSICEHHFLPFFGQAHIGYIPEGRVVGISKLVRSFEILSNRPQVQERLTDQLVDTIDEVIRPKGVAALLKAEHLCVSLRGVQKPGSRIVTYSSRGNFGNDLEIKDKFLALVSD